MSKFQIPKNENNQNTEKNQFIRHGERGEAIRAHLSVIASEAKQSVLRIGNKLSEITTSPPI
jgi:hypothetical protein